MNLSNRSPKKKPKAKKESHINISINQSLLQGLEDYLNEKDDEIGSSGLEDSLSSGQVTKASKPKR